MSATLAPPARDVSKVSLTPSTTSAIAAEVLMVPAPLAVASSWKPFHEVLALSTAEILSAASRTKVVLMAVPSLRSLLVLMSTFVAVP